MVSKLLLKINFRVEITIFTQCDEVLKHDWTPHTQRDSCVIERRFDFQDMTSEWSSFSSASRYFQRPI